jgi:hypothetical protein
MNLTKEQREWIKKKVEAALVMDKEFESFWLGEFTPAEALLFTSHNLDCNRCYKKYLHEIIRGAMKLAPKQDGGLPILSFRIGNESSRVMYVRFCKIATHWREPGFWVFRLMRLQELAEGRADEFTVVKNDSNELLLRFWWD